MFEKEAEEYTENPESAWKQGMTCVGSVRQAFKDGAEYGYKQGQSDQLVHKQYQLNQLRKANEWHYVANDDLPKVDNKIVLCVCGDGYYVDGKRHYTLKLLTRKEFSLFQPVYAWKEIVLPELKESE
jgi:hypothetical protein